MKVKLTKKFIDSIDYAAKGTDIYMDDVLTGFALRVGKQSKLYTLHKRISGKLYRDEVEEINNSGIWILHIKMTLKFDI